MLLLAHYKRLSNEVKAKNHTDAGKVFYMKMSEGYCVKMTTKTSKMLLWFLSNSFCGLCTYIIYPTIYMSVNELEVLNTFHS